MSGNQIAYKDYIVGYAEYYLTCSECGAKPREACTTSGLPVCRPRFLAAIAEVQDDATRRPYGRRRRPRTEPVVILPACPVCGNTAPSEGSWCAWCMRRAFARAGSSERWRYRKLRAFLLPHGITLARDYGRDGYYLLHFGRMVTGPFTLDVVTGAVANHWDIVISNVG